MHAKYDASISYSSKVMAKVNVLDMRVKGHGQGHLVKIFGMIGKVSPQGMYM